MSKMGKVEFPAENFGKRNIDVKEGIIQRRGANPQSMRKSLDRSMSSGISRSGQRKYRR